ncbi:unnamed protein product [Fraxinus pennsylvanica]|uniref:Uncharacterized protein n=1 Tax=Fraxinus pennsylvanica TaxID=56036 RepID=A0AAD2E5X0_9LAMI|nr:unnamed protein product [Fraxinus pennsylvanica]
MIVYDTVATFSYAVPGQKVMREPHSIIVAVGFHLEYEVAYIAETKATMPTCIRQDVVRLTIMCVPSPPALVPMNRSSPTLIIKFKLIRVQVVLQLKMKDRRDVITPSQKIYCVTTRNLIGIGHYEQIIILDASYFEKLVECNPLIPLFHKRVFTSPKSSTNSCICQSRLHEFELVPI